MEGIMYNFIILGVSDYWNQYVIKATILHASYYHPLIEENEIITMP